MHGFVAAGPTVSIPGRARSLPEGISSREHERDWPPILASMALLAGTCLEPGPLQMVSTVLWLLSLVLLTTLNAGAAFGVYVAAVGLYSRLHYPGLGTLFERPDNYALPLIVVALLLFRRRQLRLPGLRRTAVAAVGFGVFGLAHTAAMGPASSDTISWFMRAFGLPVFFFLLLASSSVTRRDIRGLVQAMIVLAFWTSIVSILQRLGAHDRLFPAWLGDPTVNDWMDTGRSGGLFMQPQWNGTVLGLTVGLLALSYRFRLYANRPVLVAAALACAPALFLTYTRAVWLGLLCMAGVLLAWSGGSKVSTYFRRSAAVSLAALALVAMAAFPSETAEDRLNNTSTIYYRLNMWNAGFAMAWDRPITGHGFAQFGESVERYGDALRRFAQHEAHAFEGAAVHHTFLSTLVAMGLPGLLLFLWALWEVIWRPRDTAAALWGRDGVLWVWAFAAFFLVQMQFVNTQEPTSNYLFYGALGLVWGLGAIPRLRPQAAPDARRRWATRPPDLAGAP